MKDSFHTMTSRTRSLLALDGLRWLLYEFTIAMVGRRIRIGGWGIVAKGVDDTNGNGKRRSISFTTPQPHIGFLTHGSPMPLSLQLSNSASYNLTTS